jgi:hypothetical protein
MKIYLTLCFVVQFSDILSKAMDFLPCSQTKMVHSKNIHTLDWLMPAADDSCMHHVISLRPSMHEGIFPLQHKQLVCTMPAMILLHLSTTVTH